MAGRIDAVLLDMGGVLIPEITGFDPVAESSELLHALAPYAFSAEDVRAAGRRLRSAYRDRAHDHSQPDPEQVFAELESPVRRLLIEAFARQETQPPYAHAREVVAELASRFRLALVSNTVVPGDHHARALEAAGILQHFEAATWSANLGVRKPSPRIFDHILEELAVTPERAVMVGDKVRTDVAGARAAGVRSIWLRLPGGEDTGDAVPDHILDDLRKLPELLQAIS